MMTGTPESVTFVPISRIEILNSRDRNMKVFEEIVDNIRSIGLKKPITVTERPGEDGQVKYLLVCGEGRLNAFRILGESHIPALIVDAVTVLVVKTSGNSAFCCRLMRTHQIPPQGSAVLLMQWVRQVDRIATLLSLPEMDLHGGKTLRQVVLHAAVRTQDALPECSPNRERNCLKNRQNGLGMSEAGEANVKRQLPQLRVNIGGFPKEKPN